MIDGRPGPASFATFFSAPDCVAMESRKSVSHFLSNIKTNHPKSLDREGQRFRAAEETTENKQLEQKKSITMRRER